MSKLPREPEAFTEHVHRLFIEHIPGSTIQITGPLELSIDDRMVSLEDLYRAALSADTDCDELIERFIDALQSVRQLEQTPLPLDVAKDHIMPRIHSPKIFQGTRPELLAHLPFVNETVILYVVEFNGVTTPITTEQLIRWGVSLDDVDELARNNLTAYQPELEMQLFQGEQGRAALFNNGDGYDAARLLLDQLYEQLAPEFDGNFLVAIPTRDVFIAFPRHSDEFITRLARRVERDYRHLPYPITSNLFLVTLDGVADWAPAA